MSAQDGTDALSLLDRAKGQTAFEAIQNAVVAWITAVGIGFITGTQTLLEFLFLPFNLLIEMATGSVQAFVLEPFGLTAVGADVTGRAIRAFEGLAALLGLPISVTIVLVTFGLIVLYLQLSITSNLFPGLFVDNRIVDFFFTSPEEEAEGEE